MGDQAVVVLLLEFLCERPGLVNDLPLRSRHHHVVLAERNARLERIVEPERHDPVAEDNRLFLTAVTIDLVDDARYFLLGHQLVDDLEGNPGRLRQDIAEHNATRSGIDPTPRRLPGLVRAVPTILDLGVEVDDLRMQSMLKFSRVAETLAFTGQAFAKDREVL